MIRRLALFAMALAAEQPRTIAGQQFDSSIARIVSPGVTHRRLVVNSGPWRLNVLEVDLRQRGLSVRGVRANDSFRGRETVRSMAARYKCPGMAVAAVNGDFFDVKVGTGQSENNVVIEGVMSKGVRTTDSPYDTFDNLHSQFGIDWRNRPRIDRFGLDARILARSRRGAIRLDGVNYWPDSNALVLYTPAVADSTPADSAGRHTLSLPLRLIRRGGDTLFFRPAGRARNGGSVPLSTGGVLAAGRMKQAELRQITARGGTVRIVLGLKPHGERLRTVVGGWPRLVREGKSVAEYADIVEGTFPRFSSGRHPRTAVGFSRDSSTLFLITVDGRRESDSGMSLVEMAKMMVNLGISDGMNMDGGGSTTMVVEGKVVNRPSDQTGERPVGSALLVVVGDSTAKPPSSGARRFFASVGVIQSLTPGGSGSYSAPPLPAAPNFGATNAPFLVKRGSSALSGVSAVMDSRRYFFGFWSNSVLHAIEQK